MKKNVASSGGSGWMELLDREEGWTWGFSWTDFQVRVKTYLAAVTELGRPLVARDRKGRWGSSFNFRNKMRSCDKQGTLSPDRRAVLSALPHFFCDYHYLAMEKMVRCVLNFCVQTGRAPSPLYSQEKPTYNRWYRLKRLIKDHNFPSDLKDLILPHLSAPNRFQIKWDQQVYAVRQYVTRFKCFPNCATNDKEVKRMGMFLNHSRIDKRKGILPEDRIRDLESIPGFEWDLPMGSPRLRSVQK
jgi:hypothetical protein